MAADTQEFRPVATGTFLGYELPDQSGAPVGATRHVVFLVTNRHVIEGENELYIRFNQGSGSRRFRLSVKHGDEGDAFSASRQFDIAACLINTEALRAAGADFSALPEAAFLDLEGIEALGVTGGDVVFTLGFPMGIAGKERKYAVVRGGVIARVDRKIVEDAGGFLIDCPVFPGNSGGPVILPPERHVLGDQSPRKRVHVIGIVAGFLPYTDTAVSRQTERPRVTFEENSGLSYVVPLDAVHDLARPLLSKVLETQEDPQVETMDDESANGGVSEAGGNRPETSDDTLRLPD